MKSDLNITKHISKSYNDELEEVRLLLIKMGDMVLGQVRDGLTSLLKLDKELAEQVIAHDKKVNQLEIKIDEVCTNILATRQPAASDLRLVICVIKTITDIERIGDEAVKLSRNALKIIQSENTLRQPNELKHLGELVIENLQEAIKAYANFDVEHALKVIEQDQETDEEFDNITRLLITKMMEDPREIKNTLRISWCARALERIGDHTTNVCEYLVFLVKGKDVRHTSLNKIKQRIE
ncbi:phosphate signaling complex protein PhoU [Psychromonas sp.]|uniref:phosphate signaling complex protein PhoU n=1 Tax=Psychromonas sp. TaxID=1884585 RepID=UPI003561A2AB